MHLIARSFYALKDTWTPLFITLPGLVAIFLLANFLTPIISLTALPVSYAVVLTLEVILLFIILKIKLRKLSI